ncbi:hypothetical protein [Streptoalloteichus tenebrarius]|uniref:hypothetical protein n=1 Tax=Streptoalloteichus tenebrarius (strain ATCC 17920 / DSM 40477 / JCM 4838 / CBS 697.72 / NBRC 16177 / NCIMB 11028 / NRRL B-12390 / A12253. 1 / ISP 5477) TaxID=1933 RepID=UPI0020A2E7AF|nr:hypothetical protein [Streptoalloteichus tenebrarius]
MLSHEEQRDRLALSCPEAVPAALVAGDPCFDRVLASRPLRDSYRRAFGAEGRRLVVVSSTWGRDGLFGRHPDLVRRLAAELPLDDHRIVVALHPNIWHGHSPWQVRSWLADCERAGVVVVPPDEGWRAALVAADLVVGDHGSVTFYGAALGVPVALAAFPDGAVDPASPVGMLGAAAPALEPTRPLLPQIERLLAEHQPERLAPVTSLTTSVPGGSAAVLRAAIYRTLDLPEPSSPAESPAVPVPVVSPAEPKAVLVRTDLDLSASDSSTDGLTAHVVRFPSEPIRHGVPVPEGTSLHVETDEPFRRWLDLAEVLVHRDGGVDAQEWITRALVAHPGCVVAAVVTPEGCVAGTVDGDLVRFSVQGGQGGQGGQGDPALCAAVLDEWRKAGRPIATLPERFSIRAGNQVTTVSAVEVGVLSERH